MTDTEKKRCYSTIEHWMWHIYVPPYVKGCWKKLYQEHYYGEPTPLKPTSKIWKTRRINL